MNYRQLSGGIPAPASKVGARNYFSAYPMWLALLRPVAVLLVHALYMQVRDARFDPLDPIPIIVCGRSEIEFIDLRTTFYATARWYG